MITECAGALRLRRVAIRLIASDLTISHASLGEELDRIPLNAWKIFLPEEGCAAVIGAKLMKAGLFSGLPPEVQREITRHSLIETQRVLGVKAQLSTVARVAKQNGWGDIVVLKGGVQVAEDGGVMFIHDLDLLARKDVAPQLAMQLRSTGYAGGEDDDAHHLTPVTSDRGVPIEIHTRWDRDEHPVDDDWWRRIRPLTTYAPLCRPGHSDQLRHLLWHMVEHHAELRGRLRDMLLAASARREMQRADAEWSNALSVTQPHELAKLQSAIAQHPMHAALRATLAFAEEIPTGNAADPFERRAAGRYVLRALSNVVRVPDMLRGQLIALTLALADRPIDLRIYARRVLPTIWQVPSRTKSEALLAWAATSLARVVRRVAAQAIVAFVAPILARIAGQARARSR